MKGTSKEKSEISDQVILVELSEIKVPERNRTFTEKQSQVLAQSIEEIGLLQPIIISEDNVLIIGRHRLGAFEILEKDKIPCVVKTYDEIDTKLAEIDENLVRFELSSMERSLQLNERQSLFQAKYPTTKAGGKRVKGETTEDSPTFIDDVVEKTGKSKSSVYSDTKLGNDLTEKTTEEIRNLIAPTSVAKNKKDLKKLIEQPLEVQEEIATLISDAHEEGKNVSVKSAMNAIHGTTTNNNASEMLKTVNRTFKTLNQSLSNIDLEDEAKYWTQEGITNIKDQFYDIIDLCDKAVKELNKNTED